MKRDNCFFPRQLNLLLPSLPPSFPFFVPMLEHSKSNCVIGAPCYPTSSPITRVADSGCRNRARKYPSCNPTRNHQTCSSPSSKFNSTTVFIAFNLIRTHAELARLSLGLEAVHNFFLSQLAGLARTSAPAEFRMRHARSEDCVSMLPNEDSCKLKLPLQVYLHLFSNRAMY